ncbi:MFS transporter [Actinocatenispora comari]|uniref:MFS transporter n=1 Tax=Actinocatenispora comari TaxID=2807577 RepID=A0A8J4AA23_9ACTN|nr:MFS transporter [Actinocatenispora comari]GIL26970.1 MFS transporter [Actinocatenispora comari]
MSIARAATDDHLPGAAPRRHRTFESLRTFNFRVFAGAQVVSNTGGWVQRIAQDWLVLSITGSATAVGITTALQAAPTVLFGIAGGALADRFAKRTILLVTQAGMGLTAAVLAVLTLSGHVAAWHVYVIAFVLGLITAVDNPTRQAFVNELVPAGQLRNAISLNSTVFQLGALVGPAVSGVLIGAVGPGWSFLANSCSFAAPIVGLLAMRRHEMVHLPRPAAAAPVRTVEVLRLVRGRPEMLWTVVLVGTFTFFTSNLAVTLSVYAKSVFVSGAGGYGLLSSVVAIGSVAGALVSARRTGGGVRSLLATGTVVAALAMVAALTSAQWAFGVVLAGLGAATLLLVTAANSTYQLSVEPHLRGRAMGVYLLVFTGSAALGGPVIGWIDQHLGPQVGLFLAGAVPLVAIGLIATRFVNASALRTRLHRLHL